MARTSPTKATPGDLATASSLCLSKPNRPSDAWSRSWLNQASLLRDDSARLESSESSSTWLSSRGVDIGSSSSRPAHQIMVSADSIHVPQTGSWRSSRGVLQLNAALSESSQQDLAGEYHLSNPLPHASSFWSVQGSSDTSEDNLEVERSSHGLNLRCHYKLLGLSSPPVFGLKSLQTETQAPSEVSRQNLPSLHRTFSIMQDRESSMLSTTSSNPSCLARTRSLETDPHGRSPLHITTGASGRLQPRSSRHTKGTLGHASGLEATLGSIVGATHAVVHAAYAVRATPKLKRVLARSQRFTTSSQHRPTTDHLGCQHLCTASLSNALTPEHRCDSATEPYGMRHVPSGGLHVYDVEQSSISHCFSSSFAVPQGRKLTPINDLETAIPLPGQTGNSTRRFS